MASPAAGCAATAVLAILIRRLLWKRGEGKRKHSAPAFTAASPLRIHWLRTVADEQLARLRGMLNENVVLTCLPKAAAQEGLNGTATVAELLGDAALGDAPAKIHVIVEGFLPAAITDAVLEEVSPSAFLIPYAGVSPALRTVLGGKGVAVFNSHHNAPMTAEMCSSLLLAAAKEIARNDAEMRAGSWTGRGIPLKGGPVPPPPCRSLTLQGKRAVILGLRGSVGRRVGKVCAALDMEVIGTSASIKASPGHKFQPYELGDGNGGFSAKAKLFPSSEPLVDLLRGAAAVVVACPLTDETKGIIGERELAAMTDDGNEPILINIGRGPCIDGDALHRAMQSAKLFHFASDVWYQYPATWEEADGLCPPLSPSGENFAEGPVGERATFSCHRGGAAGQDETERRRQSAMALAFNHAAAVGDPAALADAPGGLIGKVNLDKGY